MVNNRTVVSGNAIMQYIHNTVIIDTEFHCMGTVYVKKTWAMSALSGNE